MWKKSHVCVKVAWRQIVFLVLYLSSCVLFKFYYIAKLLFSISRKQLWLVGTKSIFWVMKRSVKERYSFYPGEGRNTGRGKDNQVSRPSQWAGNPNCEGKNPGTFTPRWHCSTCTWWLWHKRWYKCFPHSRSVYIDNQYTDLNITFILIGFNFCVWKYN